MWALRSLGNILAPKAFPASLRLKFRSDFQVAVLLLANRRQGNPNPAEKNEFGTEVDFVILEMCSMDPSTDFRRPLL